MNAIPKKPPAAARKISVILADDHPVVRDGLAAIVNQQADMEVVAEAGDSDTEMRYVRVYKPTVLLLDLSMPGRSSLEAVRGCMAKWVGSAIWWVLMLWCRRQRDRRLDPVVGPRGCGIS